RADDARSAERDAETPSLHRREPQRQEPGFQKEKVPLELQELLAGDRKRKVERPADEQGRDRDQADEDQHRGDRSSRAEKMEEAVPRVEPQERRHEGPPRSRKLRARALEEVADRKDSARTDEPVHLEPQRDERHEKAEAEQAEEERVRERVRGR